MFCGYEQNQQIKIELMFVFTTHDDSPPILLCIFLVYLIFSDLSSFLCCVCDLETELDFILQNLSLFN